MPREGSPPHHAGHYGEYKTQISQLDVDLFVRSDACFTITQTTGVLFRGMHHDQL